MFIFIHSHAVKILKFIINFSRKIATTIWCIFLTCPLCVPLVDIFVTAWQIDGERVETVSDFILGGPKITADDECSHEIKRHSLEGKV